MSHWRPSRWLAFWIGWGAASLFHLVSSTSPEKAASNVAEWIALFGG